MGLVGSTAVVETVVAIDQAITNGIYNVTCVLANTEYSQALPSDTRGFIIQARQNAELKLSFIATESSTNYVTIKPGYTYNNTKKSGSLTLYFQSPQAGTVAEIMVEYV